MTHVEGKSDEEKAAPTYAAKKWNKESWESRK
jgi:hypothetical protein